MVNFTLSALNQEFTIGLSGELAGEAPAWTVSDVSAVAVYNVNLADLSGVFKFQSDSFDVNDVSAADIQYYVYKNAWPANLKLNPVHAGMIAGGTPGVILATSETIVANKNLVKHDFLRYLALKLFNTPHGVDLFSNEDALLADLVTKGTTARTSIEAALELVDQGHAAGGTAPHAYSTNALTTPANICRELMRQIASVAASRFYGMENVTTIQRVPIAAGDTINFKLSLTAAAGQEDLTDRPTAFDTRVYQIQLNVVADSASNTLPVEAGSATEYAYHAV
jgi:hypothetical protein